MYQKKKILQIVFIIQQDLLNKCIEMIRKEEMQDQSLYFICSLNRNLPIENIDDQKVFSTSEELFTFLEQEYTFSNCVLQSISKFKFGFQKVIQLIDDYKKFNQMNGTQSPSSPLKFQMDDENDHIQNKNKRTPNKMVDENNMSSPFRKEPSLQSSLSQQQQPSLSQKLKQDVLKISNLNSKLLNAIDEQSLLNNQKIVKEYIETCSNRLSAILECLRGMKRNFNVNLIKTLFDIYCQNEFIPQDKELFYNLLTTLVTDQRQMNRNHQIYIANDQNNQQSRQCFELLDQESFRYIFNDILLRFDINYFSPVIMNCFEAYFFYINEYIRNFVQTQSKSQIINLFEPSKTCPSSQDPQQPTNNISYIIKSEQIWGIERFWELYLRHQDPAISNHAGTIISRIIMFSCQYSEQTVSEKIKQQYIEQIMVQLKDSYDALTTNGGINNLNNQLGKNNNNNNQFPLFNDNNGQEEVGRLKQFYNQILQRSLDLLNKLLLNLDKSNQQPNNQQNNYKTITIQVDFQVINQNKEKFTIQVRTNQTIREVFAIIGVNIPLNSYEFISQKRKKLLKEKKPFRQYKQNFTTWLIFQTFFINLYLSIINKGQGRQTSIQNEKKNTLPIQLNRVYLDSF